MHPGNPRPGYPAGPYYPSPQHPGHHRPPHYHHLPQGGSNPSFQSLTSHWNLPPTPMSHPGSAAGFHPHPGAGPTSSAGPSGGGGSSKSKYAALGQYGLTIQQPKAPDKPLLPYMRYSRKMWEELKSDGKRVWDVQTFAEVGKIIGQKWREMSEEDKQPYCDEYEAEKLVYNEQMKAYRNSAAYKRWNEQKTQAEANRDAASVQQSAAAAAAQQFHPDYTNPHSTIPRLPPNTDPRLLMQQQQQMSEDEEDEYVQKKQEAATRYQRNHRLMAELFSDYKVPDVTKHVVNKNRLVVLKKQVQSLEAHQRKLQEEVDKIDKRYEEKKRKFLEDSENFRRELKKIQDNPPTTWKKPVAVPSVVEMPEVENPKYIKL